MVFLIKILSSELIDSQVVTDIFLIIKLARYIQTSIINQHTLDSSEVIIVIHHGPYKQHTSKLYFIELKEYVVMKLHLASKLRIFRSFHCKIHIPNMYKIFY